MSGTMISRSRYSPVVRIGNWFEEICLEEDKINLFRNARDRGQLLVEKTRRLFDNFHREIELEAPKETVRFGAIVQLMPVEMNICDEISTDIRPALSVVINEDVVRYSQKINDRCELTIAPSTAPCVRNSFQITSADEKNRNNELLKYGQHFRLQCVDTDDDPLYLYSVSKSADLSTMITTTFESTKCGEVNLPLGLVFKRNCGANKNVPNAFANFFCQHINPDERFETNDTPIPSNKSLVITHVATNRNLAAERVAVQTLFGSEFLVSIQNYRDIYKRELWNNKWMISNGHNYSPSA